VHAIRVLCERLGQRAAALLFQGLFLFVCATLAAQVISFKYNIHLFANGFELNLAHEFASCGRIQLTQRQDLSANAHFCLGVLG
jgi:hypothetical protein